MSASAYYTENVLRTLAEYRVKVLSPTSAKEHEDFLSMQKFMDLTDNYERLAFVTNIELKATEKKVHDSNVELLALEDKIIILKMECNMLQKSKRLVFAWMKEHGYVLDWLEKTGENNKDIDSKEPDSDATMRPRLRLRFTQPKKPERLSLTRPRNSKLTIVDDTEKDIDGDLSMSEPGSEMDKPIRLRIRAPRKPQTLKFTPPKKPQRLRLTPSRRI